MKYQALLLVIAILFSTFMLRALGERDDLLNSNVITETQLHTSLPLYSATSSPRIESFTPIHSDGSLNVSLQKPAVSSQDVSAVEKPSVSQNTSSQCSVTASIFLVRDVTNGKNIISQDIHRRWPIASISKLMTVLIAYHYMDSKEVVSITKAMRDSAQGYASLEVGASYSVNDLIRAALVVSSNDAAYALSETFGYDAFIAKMNEEAKIIGMTDTSFFEPSGLSYLNQSTASDISLLLNYLYKSAPELLATTRKQTVLLYDYAHRKNVSLSNIDYFAGTEGFIGGKTGFINESGGNLATLFNEGSSVWAVEVFGSSDRFGDIQKLLKCAHNL